MSNFSEFIKNNNNVKESKQENHKYSNDELQDMINKYSTLSEDKLINEFIKLTIEKKRKGELSDSQLEQLKKTIVPMLDEKQVESLNNLIQLVKNV